MPATMVPGQMYPSGHWNDGVHAINELLEDWFLAMEDGSVKHRLPDATYQRRGGKPDWTEDDLERLMKALDEEYDQEVNRAPGVQHKCDAGPGWQRLAGPQRLALAQLLDALVGRYEQELPNKPCPQCRGPISQHHICPCPDCGAVRYQTVEHHCNPTPTPPAPIYLDYD